MFGIILYGSTDSFEKRFLKRRTPLILFGGFEVVSHYKFSVRKSDFIHSIYCINIQLSVTQLPLFNVDINTVSKS